MTLSNLLGCVCLLLLNFSNGVWSDCPKGCTNCNFGTLNCKGDVNQKISHLPSSENIPKNVNKIVIQRQAPEFRDVVINSTMFESYARFKFSIVDITIMESGIKRIKSNAFAEMKDLTQLILSKNDIEIVEDYAFNNLNLKMLILQDNTALKLSIRSFHGLSTSTLNLKNCGLKTISYNIIQPLESNLQNLMLDSNQLRSLDINYERWFRSIGTLSLKDNPFNCNCELEWLSRTLVYRKTNNNRAHSIGDSNRPQCATPDNLKDRQLEDIPASLYKCHPPKISELSLEMVSSSRALFKCIPKSTGVVSIIYSRVTSSGDRSSLSQIYGNSQEASQMSVFNITRMGDDERFRCLIQGKMENSSADVRIRWPRTTAKIDNVKVPLLENDKTEQPNFVKNSNAKTNKELPREPPVEKNFFFQKKYTLLEMIGSVIGTFTITLGLFLFIYRCFVYKKKKERKKSPYSNYNYEHNVVMFTPETQTYDIPHHPSYPIPPPPPPRDHYLDYKNQRTLPYNRV